MQGRDVGQRATRLVGGALVFVLFAAALLGSVGASRVTTDPADGSVQTGRVESYSDLSRRTETFVPPAVSKPVLRALPRSGFALWLLVLAALAALAAMAGLKPGHGAALDARAIAAQCGAARLPRRRGPPVLTS